MVVAFENIEIRMLCENESIALEKFGSTKLHDRLADLFAANTVRDLLLGNPEETEFMSLNAFKIDIEEGQSLYFVSNHVKTPYLKDGNINWDEVKRIKIIAIQI